MANKMGRRKKKTYVQEGRARDSRIENKRSIEMETYPRSRRGLKRALSVNSRERFDLQERRRDDPASTSEDPLSIKTKLVFEK